MVFRLAKTFQQHSRTTAVSNYMDDSAIILSVQCCQHRGGMGGGGKAFVYQGGLTAAASTYILPVGYDITIVGRLRTVRVAQSATSAYIFG